MLISKLILWVKLFSFMPSLSAENPAQKMPDPVMSHVANSHIWHFATWGERHYILHLPIIIYKQGEGIAIFSSKRFFNGHHNVAYRGFCLDTVNQKIEALDGTKIYDFSMTRDLCNTILSILLLLLVFLSMAFYYRRRSILEPPKGLWVLLTYLICFVRDHIAKENIGEKDYKRFTPYLLTIFWFIWLNNTLGLLPGAGNVTGNISVTLVLATCTFFVTNLNGSHDYWMHILKPPGVPIWLLPMIVPTELLGLFTKTVTLMMRLTINILAGHLVLLNIINVIFILQSIFASIVIVPLGAIMIFFKLGIGFLQAYIFTLLSAVYIGGAVATHEEAHAEHTTPLTLNSNP